MTWACGEPDAPGDPGSGETDPSAGTTAASSGDSDTTGTVTESTGDTTGDAATTWQGTGPWDPTAEDPPPCEPPPCPAGEVGCACEDETCQEGTCSQGFCVVLVDERVRVPAGPFCMGCSPGDDACVAHESPEHEVTLEAFEIDRHEATQAEYKACVDAGACPEVGVCAGTFDPDARADHPAICLSFEMAEAYCTWAGKQLPTEAQWEKAARGVHRTRYPWGEAIADCERANLELGDVTPCEGQGDTAPVGSRPAGASPYGAMDMSGNVWERVADWFDPHAYRRGPVADPVGPPTGSSRVLRGGAYTSPETFVRATTRDGAFEPELAGLNVGVRCVQTP